MDWDGVFELFVGMASNGHLSDLILPCS
jgi:hypothetical protein